MLREASTPASFMPERKEKSPFAANFSTKLGSVNNKLTYTLSCAADGDCGGGGGGGGGQVPPIIRFED